MDVRAHGKGFDSYIERAREQQGVRYKRSMISSSTRTQNGNLIIETFDHDRTRRWRRNTTWWSSRAGSNRMKTSRPCPTSGPSNQCVRFPDHLPRGSGGDLQAGRVCVRRDRGAQRHSRDRHSGRCGRIRCIGPPARDRLLRSGRRRASTKSHGLSTQGGGVRVPLWYEHRGVVRIPEVLERVKTLRTWSLPPAFSLPAPARPCSPW